METSLELRALNYLNALRDKPIRNGDTLDIDVLWRIALRAPEAKDIREIFATNGGMPSAYYTYAYCEGCEDVGYRHANKTDVIAFMEYVNANFKSIPEDEETRPTVLVRSCFRCAEKLKLKKREKRKKECENYNAEILKRKQEHTDFIISTYLNPEYTLPINSTMAQAAAMMDGSITFFNEKTIKDVINGMNYNDFLKTMYWRICAYRAKKKSGFRCAMCGSKDNLNVHHSTYEFHGSEHTRDGLKSLTCVCKDCHSKHHGHHE